MRDYSRSKRWRQRVQKRHNGFEIKGLRSRNSMGPAARRQIVKRKLAATKKPLRKAVVLIKQFKI